jgi:uncharacterized protein YuzE
LEKGRRTQQIEREAAAFFRRFANDSKIEVFYDRSVDVLYINYVKSPIKKADHTWDTGDYVFRYKDGKLIGVTIIDAQEHHKKDFRDLPLNPTKQAIRQLVIAQ